MKKQLLLIMCSLWFYKMIQSFWGYDEGIAFISKGRHKYDKSQLYKHIIYATLWKQ